MTHRVGAYHVECQAELALTLGIEVVVHRAFVVARVVVHLIGKLIKIILCSRESHIRKVHQNDDTFLVATDATHFSHLFGCHTLRATLVGSGTTLGSMLLDDLCVYRLIDFIAS